jgi:ribA/ribD-fused uncharacterized protein
MPATRTYHISESIVFHKTKDLFGGLSNMASGFSVNVNNIVIPTIEHLYQALRFADSPQLQLDIISEPSPMNAKWIGRKYIQLTRADWEKECFNIMLWCLQIKLSQNWDSFGKLLLSTENKSIVELAPKGKIWGAMREGDYLIGVNALGRLIMFLRETYVKPDNRIFCVHPLNIEKFTLLGHPIDLVCDDIYYEEIEWSMRSENTPV